MKIGIKNGFYIMIIQTILIGISYSKEWEPLELANYTRKNDFVIDTNTYLDKSSQAYTNILNYVTEIQDLRKFQVYVFFIDSISSKYNINFLVSSTKDIEKFVNDLAWYLLKGNVEDDKNSLIILFSINDRQNRIRTGEYVKKYLTDIKASSYLERLKSKLRSRNYIDALEDLMNNINWRITKDTSFYDFLDTLMGVFLLILICVVLFKNKSYRQSRNENQRDYIAESKLDKIKKISEKNKENANFIEDVCIICLEDFTEQEKNSLKKSNCKQEINKIEKKDLNVEKKENVIIEDNKKHELNNNQVEINLNLINTNINNNAKNDKHKNFKHDDVIRINEINFENKGNIYLF